MKPLGRNQQIAIAGYGFPLLMVFSLCVGGTITGGAFADFVGSYVPLSMLTILGVSGAIKGLSQFTKKADK